MINHPAAVSTSRSTKPRTTRPSASRCRIGTSTSIAAGAKTLLQEGVKPSCRGHGVGGVDALVGVPAGEDRLGARDGVGRGKRIEQLGGDHGVQPAAHVRHVVAAHIDPRAELQHRADGRPGRRRRVRRANEFARMRAPPAFRKPARRVRQRLPLAVAGLQRFGARVNGHIARQRQRIAARNREVRQEAVQPSVLFGLALGQREHQAVPGASQAHIGQPRSSARDRSRQLRPSADSSMAVRAGAPLRRLSKMFGQ